MNIDSDLVSCIAGKLSRVHIGATEIYVAVPDGRSNESVRQFDTFTDDLHEAAKWLKECGGKSIAMESTSLVEKPMSRTASGLQDLHSVGLLRGSFRPVLRCSLSAQTPG